jgi:hypothetical protein
MSEADVPVDPDDDGDDEDALCGATERLEEYLRARNTPVAHTRIDALMALTGRFLYGDRKMFGVRVDDGCRMLADHDQPTFFEKWLRDHPQNVARDVRWHAKRMVAAMRHAAEIPGPISAFAERVASPRPVGDAAPDAWYRAVHHAQALTGLAKAVRRSVADLLETAGVADALPQLGGEP